MDTSGLISTTYSEAVTALAERARALTIDVSDDIRADAMRLKIQARRLLKSPLKDDDTDALHDLMIALDVIHRGRIPAVAVGA